MMRHVAAAFLAVALLIGTLVAGIAYVFPTLPANGATADRTVLVDATFPRGLPHAYAEGECFSYRCVWNARKQGNGEGSSLILTRWHGDYLVQPISHKRARVLQASWCRRANVTCEGYTD